MFGFFANFSLCLMIRYFQDSLCWLGPPLKPRANGMELLDIYSSIFTVFRIQKQALHALTYDIAISLGLIGVNCEENYRNHIWCRIFEAKKCWNTFLSLLSMRLFFRFERLSKTLLRWRHVGGRKQKIPGK